MDKIKLANGTIINTESIDVTGDKMNIRITNTSLITLRNTFDNSSNITTIEVLTEGDVTCAIYNGYKKVDKYIIEIGEVETIGITLIKQSEIEERIENMENVLETFILSELGAM